MAQRLEKIKEITGVINHDGVSGAAKPGQATVIKIGKGNTNCNIYYNRRAEDLTLDGPWMVSCPNCARRVSRKAASCPGCCHPVALHFKKIALQKTVKALGVTLAATIAALFAIGQSGTPFLSFLALANMIALAGACHELGKIPAHA